MTEKLTDWFDPSVKPTIPGWYEREYWVPSLQKYYDWWDGNHWYGYMGGKLDKSQISIVPRRWRGLAEKLEA